MTETIAADPHARRAKLKFLLLVLVLGGLALIGWQLGLVDQVQRHQVAIHDYVRSWGAWGPILFAALCATALVLAIPRTIMTVSGALIFGTIGGTLVVVAGSTVGASLAFLISRYLGRDYVASRLDGRWKSLDQELRVGGFNYLLCLRLLPLAPSNVVNYGCGLTAIRFRDYLLATVIGITPGTLIYSYATTSLVGAQQAKGPLVLALSLLAILALAPLALRQWRQGRREHDLNP